MKQRIASVAKAAVIVLLLVLFALMLKDASDTFRANGVDRYDATRPVTAKFAALARWFPANAELVVAADVPVFLQRDDLRAHLTGVMRSGGAAGELIRLLLEEPGALGMLALVGTLGSPEGTPRIAAIAQGRFDEETFLPAIRALLAEGRSGLVAEEVGDRTLYTEAGTERPFGFAILDGTHLAVGERAALVHLLPAMSGRHDDERGIPDAPLFGHLVIGPRLRAMLPPELGAIARIDFASPNGTALVARIPCDDPSQAASVRMFLEGVRSLLLLQTAGRSGIEKLVEGFALTDEGETVVVTGSLLPLITLLAPAPTPLAP